MILIMENSMSNCSVSYSRQVSESDQIHMSEFLEPQQESAAACENMDIGPFSKGPKQMTTISTFHYSINTGVEALSF